MKVSLKRLIAVLLTSVTLFAVIGCAQNGNEEAKGNDEQITLKFMWWGSPNRKEITLKVIELFEKANPHIKIETEDHPNASVISTQLAMKTADQTTPDIIQADYSFIFNYINRDLIEPLDSYIESNMIDITDVDPLFLLSGQSGGKQYGIPMGTNALAMAYDPAMFEEYGIEPLENGYTLDDLYTAMKLFKDKVNTPDFYPLDNMFDISYWFRTKGESFYNKEGTNLGYTDPSMVEYMTLVKKWTDEGLLNPNVLLAQASVNDTNALAAGRTAFFPVPSNNVVSLGSMAGRTIKLLDLPKYEGAKEGNFIKPSMFIAASSYSEHKEEVAKFISFITNSQEANDILRGDRGVPIAAKVAEQLSSQSNEQDKEQYSHISYVTDHSTPIDPPTPKFAGVIQNSLQIKLNNLIAGSITPEQAVSSFRTEAEGIMGQGAKVNE